MLNLSQAAEQLRNALVGRFYSKFSVHTGFELDFGDFVLAAQEIESPDEELVNRRFVSSYPPANQTARSECIGKSAILATCLGITVSDVAVAEDASLVLRFTNGVQITLPTSTSVVDWHWAITEGAEDPYVSCIIACFAPAEIQGSIANYSLKPAANARLTTDAMPRAIDDDAKVEVAVEYQLKEYKRVLRDFYPMHLAATGKKPNRLMPWNWPIVEELLFAVVAPIVFFIKKRRVGNCIFTFSETELSRASKSGVGNKTWSEVKAVHRLSAAYLIELKAGGAMPVPYRVFTPEQRQLFEVFAQRVEPNAA